MKLKIRMVIFIVFIMAVGFACQLTSPTPASWSGTPTARVRELTNTAIALTQGIVQEEDYLPTPTGTPARSNTAEMRSPTPIPDGPWIVYPAPGGDALHAYDVESKTITSIKLPQPIFWEDLEHGLSPDGTSLIMRAGLPSNTDEFGLYAINMDSASATKITPLLSLLLQRRIVNQEGTLAFEVLDVVSRSDGLAWSSDSRYLAFSAALDNQTSDLYVFDTMNGRITRVNGLPTHNASPFWGTSSNMLVSQELGKTSDGETWRAENVTGVTVPDFNNQNTLYLPISESLEEKFVGWINAQSFISYALTSDGSSTLQRVNTEDLEISILHQGLFKDVALDPTTRSLALILDNEAAAPFGNVEGVYLLGIEDIEFQLQRGGAWTDLFWDSGGLFIVSGTQGVFAFATDDEGLLLNDEKTAEVSPIGNWIIAWGEGARLYQLPSTNSLQTITENNVQTVFWQPDSKAFYILSDGTLYSASFPNLRLQMIEDGFLQDEPLMIAWIRSEADE